jgi:hypothetical protein
MPAIPLQKLNCKVTGKGPWGMTPDTDTRSVIVRNLRNGFAHRVYYGTRTGRTLEGAEELATALCAILNALKAKSI